MEELKGIYKKKENRLEVYYKNELIVDEEVLNKNDYWVGSEIVDKPVDFNFWSEDEEKFNLTIYTDVITDDLGHLSTNPYIYEPVYLIVI